MKPKAIDRSKAVRARFLETQERRAKLAQEFRQRLFAELPPASGDSAVRAAMIACAVSAFVQVVEISEQYFSNRAKPYATRALTVARGELRRALQALNLIEASREPVDTVPHTPAEVIALIERQEVEP